MNQQKNAIIISLNDDVSEIKQLANTLNYNIIKEFVQKRKIPDVNYYIGSGKLDEIKDFVDKFALKVDLLIVNGELKPSQWFALEKELSVDVNDRIRLILAIFEEHAERKEAKLQVKLAKLQYERPYVRELIHRARAGEHPGLMAGGEYQVDDYYEMIKKQMKKIRQNLKKIRDVRQVHRKTRYKSGFYLVSLAGYTNAGKSSLLNLFSGEKVRVEGRLFSTLSTTTRRIPINTRGSTIPILLTDTVGFIENLPAWIIDAFHSTLEEIEVADVVILVVDGSEKKELVEKKLKVSLDELIDLEVNSPIIIAINKIDLIDDNKTSDLINYLNKKGFLNAKSYVPISISKEINIGRLLGIIYDSLPNMIEIIFRLPNNKQSQSFVFDLYKRTRIIDVKFEKNINIKISCNPKIRNKIIAQCQKLEGTIL